MDIFKVAGMFIQTFGAFLVVLTAGMVTLALQLGGGLTMTHVLSLAFGVGAIWLGRVTEQWGKR